MQRPLAHENWLGEQVRAGPGTDRQTERALGAGGARGQRRPWLGTAAQALLLLPEDGAGSSPEQVELDSSSLFPQSLSPSQSQRLGMQRLFLHLKRSEGQVCWSVGRHTQDHPQLLFTAGGEKNREQREGNLQYTPSTTPAHSPPRAGEATQGSWLHNPNPATGSTSGESSAPVLLPQQHINRCRTAQEVVTHGRAQGPRRCCPGSRCPRRISSAPGCSGCSCRRTPRAGTAEGGCRTGWLAREKQREGMILTK